MKTPAFTVVVGVMIALAVIGTIVSAVAVYAVTKRDARARCALPRTATRSASESQQRGDAAVRREQRAVLDEA